jgi:ribonuclease Y
METISLIVGVFAGIVVGGAGGYALSVALAKMRMKDARGRADEVLEQARRESETLLKESRIQAREEVHKAKEEFENSCKSRKGELTAQEDRMKTREENLERKLSLIERRDRSVSERETDLGKREAELGKREADLAAARGELVRLLDEQKAALQKVAGMTQEEAKQLLLSRVESELHNEVGVLIRRSQEHARETAEREARKIVTLAIQRYAASHACESMTSTVHLPTDDMKGRIIGRDGRNIRTLESVTGVNLLIDDTPEAVVVSAFDPVRREVARQSLERLIADGRIHPARIEEVVTKVREELENTMREAGEEAAYQCGMQSSDPEVIRMLGRLKFRTSYSQNVLMHSLEVAHLMGLMAPCLGLDPTLAKRIGLLHDIGKAMDHEVEGGHAVIGADFLRRHGEPQVVTNAVGAHHEEMPPESLYATLAAAADAISGSRPGARCETTEIYIKRLEKLEAIANGFSGVEKSYAIQAGREIRVIVVPEKVDDHASLVMARNITKKIETELQYPGQIKVVVIRETRAVEYAK